MRDEHLFLCHLFIANVAYFSVELLVAWLIVCRGRRPRAGEHVPGPEEISRYLVAGWCYCNPDDSRGWILKSSDPAHGSRYAINMRYRSWVTAYSVLQVGGGVLYILSLVCWAQPGFSKWVFAHLPK